MADNVLQQISEQSETPIAKEVRLPIANEVRLPIANEVRLRDIGMLEGIIGRR